MQSRIGQSDRYLRASKFIFQYFKRVQEEKEGVHEEMAFCLNPEFEENKF